MVMKIGGSTDIGISQTTASSSGTKREESATRRLTAKDEAFVQELMRAFGSKTTADTAGARKNAIKDTKGIVDELFRSYKEQALPEIMSKQQQSGGYGATTTQMLGNDAYARTVNQAAATQLNAISAYEATELNRSQLALQGLSTSLQSLIAAREDTTASGAFSTKSKSTTKSLNQSGEFSMGF